MQFRKVRGFDAGRVFRFGVLVLGMWASSPIAGFAQGEASIQGLVTDASGGAVPSVAIRIKNLETRAQRNLLTDTEGRFDAAALPVGRYEVLAEKNGFRTEEKIGISVVVGQREPVDIVLQVGDVRQTVQVESAPTLVAITTEDDSGLVGERQVKDLPLNGRSYDQLMTLNPGIVNYTSRRARDQTSNSVVIACFPLAAGHRRIYTC